MAGVLNSLVLDFGLDVVADEATHIVVCSSEPTAYSLCSIGSSNLIGYKSFGAGGCFGSPESYEGGRKIDMTAITDGTITTTGTVRFWCAIDEVNGRMLGYAPISNPGVETAGNQFKMPTLSIRMRNE